MKQVLLAASLSSILFADWSFVDIRYTDETGKSVSVKSMSKIPECKAGEVRYKCTPPPYMAMLIQPCVCYTKCMSKKKVESLSWLEKKKICLWW